MSDFSPCLEEATFHKTGTAPLPKPVKSSAEQILLQGIHDGSLVQLEAQLLQNVSRSARPKLVLQDGSVIFIAQLNGQRAERQLPEFRSGSVLRLTGVCDIQGSDVHEAQAFRILIATPADIQVLSAPSWWTSRHTLTLAGALAFGILAAFGWIGSLRRQVSSQTEVIRQKLQEGKEFAESLAREKTLLATLIDHLPDNVFVKDTSGKYVLTNRAHTRFHGARSADHFVGKTSFDLLPHELARAYEEADQRILKEDLGIFQAEEPAKNGLGDHRWLSTTKVPLKDGTGQIIGLLGISRDITEWKKAEAQLAYERDLLKALLDNLPDVIYFKDLQSRFVRVSRSKVESSFQFLLCQHRAAHQGDGDASLPAQLASVEQFSDYVLGRTDFDLFDPDRAQAAFEDEQEIIRTGKPLIGKMERSARADGKTSWCLSTKMPWHDKDGNIIGTFGISKDITSIKEAEAKLEEVHKELLVASRQAGMAEVATSVLHNVGNVLNSVNVSASVVVTQIKQSKVGNLARVVELMRQHETDLGAFISNDPKGRQLPGYLGQLAEHLAAEQRGILTELQSLTKNIDHIEEIVTMQQSYAKVAGLTEMVRPSDLVEDALRMNAGALARHDVHIYREFDAKIPEIAVEKHKVLQILVNLVRNAKYACDESGRSDKHLTVRVANGEGRLKISVTDNGVGIPPENMKRIFNHGFTTRKHGHGFGLHSGALAAQELGGSLSASSDGPGKGATFTLELPVTAQ